MKYTPGPWKFCTGIYNRPDDDHGMGSVVTGDDDPWFICEIEDMPEWSANATLIAAAPELFEAAEAAWNCISDLPPTQARVEVAQMLCAAIAKARGEP